MSASQAALSIARGEITSEQLVASCLARIAAREPHVRAWAYLDPERAMNEARARDAELKSSGTRGALHGVPVGVKDVLDTSDMPTQMGSAIYEGWQPKTDAACVALVRKAGGVILGKTVTCELAGIAPRDETTVRIVLATPRELLPAHKIRAHRGNHRQPAGIHAHRLAAGHLARRCSRSGDFHCIDVLFAHIWLESHLAGLLVVRLVLAWMTTSHPLVSWS